MTFNILSNADSRWFDNLPWEASKSKIDILSDKGFFITVLCLSPWGNLNYNSVNILCLSYPPHSEKIYPTFVECSSRNVINICQKRCGSEFCVIWGEAFKARTWFTRFFYLCVSWPDCFVSLNPGVQIMKQRLAKFQWMCSVRYTNYFYLSEARIW